MPTWLRWRNSRFSDVEAAPVPGLLGPNETEEQAAMVNERVQKEEAAQEQEEEEEAS